MPWAAPTPCAHPGCPAVSRGRYCADHERPARQAADARRPPPEQRGYDRRWRKLRRLILNRDPICKICGRRPSTEVDHLVPLAAGGDNSPTNLQGVCKRCHSKKTATEDGGFGRPRRSVEGKGGEISGGVSPHTVRAAKRARSRVSGGGGVA